MERSQARGFSLLEVVVSVAIAILLGWLLFHALSQMLLASRLQSQRDLEAIAAGRIADSLSSEEDDAWAIFVPPADVAGKPNSDGHEVDFFERDGKQLTYFWSYTYDAGTQTLTRYRYGFPGSSPVKDVTYSGVTNFYARTYPVTALQDPNAPVYSPLYAGANLQSGIVHFYPNMPWIASGNDITYVHFETATLKRDLQLVTQTAPSGFTVVLNYTPTPAPTSTPSAFRTWPATLVVGANGAGINLTSGSLAAVSPKLWIARALNGLLGGGIARAASECYALAYDATGANVDNSLDSFRSVEQSLGVYVDSNGCEVDGNDMPLPSPVIVAYEPSGTSETFRVQAGASGCSLNMSALDHGCLTARRGRK